MHPCAPQAKADHLADEKGPAGRIQRPPDKPERQERRRTAFFGPASQPSFGEHRSRIALADEKRRRAVKPDASYGGLGQGEKRQASLLLRRSPRAASPGPANDLCDPAHTPLSPGFITMWRFNQRRSAHTMPKPKPLTTFTETMIRTHYGRRTIQWMGDRLGCSPAAVVAYAKQLGLRTPKVDLWAFGRFCT